jgi:hypothetical protein
LTAPLPLVHTPLSLFPTLGKSSLIAALAEANRESSASLGGNAGPQDHDGDQTEDVIFSSMDVPAADLQGTQVPLRLKIWEYSSHLTKEETELVLRGALFCVITFDLRSPESANSAFNNWLVLKETFMLEAFLFVVGTHVDHPTSRRVETAGTSAHARFTCPLGSGFFR